MYGWFRPAERSFEASLATIKSPPLLSGFSSRRLSSGLTTGEAGVLLACAAWQRSQHDYRSLRRAAGRAEFLADLGGAVADSDLEIGDASLDEQTAMARDAFRRFAAEADRKLGYRGRPSPLLGARAESGRNFASLNDR
jgi:hypothetical protein